MKSSSRELKNTFFFQFPLLFYLYRKHVLRMAPPSFPGVAPLSFWCVTPPHSYERMHVSWHSTIPTLACRATSIPTSRLFSNVAMPLQTRSETRGAYTCEFRADNCWNPLHNRIVLIPLISSHWILAPRSLTRSSTLLFSTCRFSKSTRRDAMRS